jgi:multimeric flavodoxin WrbA
VPAGNPPVVIPTSAGGGTEATLLTAIPYLAHQGMMFVPAGYGAGPSLFSVEELRGGSPWGASTYAGADGSRKPSALELEIAVTIAKLAASPQLKFNTDIYCLQLIVVNYLSVQNCEVR